MKPLNLDHVNIQTADVTRLSSWYCNILGLKEGPRPDFQGPKGKWLYLGDTAILHLAENKSIEPPETPGLEHFSLTAKGLKVFQVQLDKANINYKLLEVPEIGLIQVNLADCDGNHIHIDFPLNENV